jgi:hypothetical protein
MGTFEIMRMHVLTSRNVNGRHTDGPPKFPNLLARSMIGYCHFVACRNRLVRLNHLPGNVQGLSSLDRPQANDNCVAGMN